MMTKKEAVEKKVVDIVELFSFENMQKTNPNFCPCYGQNKPCHQMGELNCFFCYCPQYDNTTEEGGCKLSSTKGKWFVHPSHKTGRVWDCSDCDYPHRKEVVKKYLTKLFN